MRLTTAFVYNPTISTDETTADENIQGFYPPSVSLDQQMNEVGLCTAVTAMQDRFSATTRASPFTSKVDLGETTRSVFGHDTVPPTAASSSSPSSPSGSSATPAAFTTRSFTTGSRRFTIVPVETNFFVAVSTTRGYRPRPGRGARGGSFGSSSSAPAPIQVMPAAEDDADDAVVAGIESYVRCYYRVFKMMFGSLRMNYEKIVRPLTKKDLRALATDADREAAVARRRREMALFREVVQVGMVAKLVGELQDCLFDPSTDGVSLVAPHGMELLPVSGTAALSMGSLVGVLHNAHPGALRGVVAMSDGCVFHSTLPADDTATLYRLVDYYSRRAPPPTPTGRSSAPPPSSNTNATKLRNTSWVSSIPSSPASSVGATWADPRLLRAISEDTIASPNNNSNPFSSASFDPRTVLASEGPRASCFRRSMRAPAGGAASPTSVSMRELGNDSLTGGGVADAASIGSGGTDLGLFDGGAYIFLDDAPVGVLTLDLGPVQLLLLVRDKYLMVPELQAGLKVSVEAVLAAVRGRQQMTQFVLPSVPNSRRFDATFLYHYTNAMNHSTKSSVRTLLMRAVAERALTESIVKQGAAERRLADRTAVKSDPHASAHLRRTVRLDRADIVQAAQGELVRMPHTHPCHPAAGQLDALRCLLCAATTDASSASASHAQRLRGILCRTGARTWIYCTQTEWRSFAVVIEADTLLEAERAAAQVVRAVFVGIFPETY